MNVFSIASIMVIAINAQPFLNYLTKMMVAEPLYQQSSNPSGLISLVSCINQILDIGKIDGFTRVSLPRNNSHTLYADNYQN
jgi:hypothetical protein